MCILLLRAAPLFWEAQNLPPAPAWIQFSACYYDGCSLLKFREERDLLFFFEKSKNTSRSTKSAPSFLDFSVRTAQPCPSPTACCVPPHPLQNRVPRGERAPVALCCEPTEPTGETKSFCPCQKSQVSLLRYLTFSLVCGRIWQRGTAAPCAMRVVG